MNVALVAPAASLPRSLSSLEISCGSSTEGVVCAATAAMLERALSAWELTQTPTCSEEMAVLPPLVTVPVRTTLPVALGATGLIEVSVTCAG